jgi:hypothetical protein
MAAFARSRKRRRKRLPDRSKAQGSVRAVPLRVIPLLLLAPLVYILGRWRVIDTQTAIAIAAMVLLGALLYFPLRYRTRLTRGGQLVVWGFALVWFGVLATPVLKRIYPSPAITSFEIQAADVPYALPVAILERNLELKVTGHLREGQPHATRNGKWHLRIQPPQGKSMSFGGNLQQSWGAATPYADQPLQLRQSRITTNIRVPPLPIGSRISTLRFSGQAQPRLTIIARPNGQFPLALQRLLGGLLLLGAATYDKVSGAGRTASALTVVTGAALVSVLSFPALGASEATFRELFGAIVAGALVGGPVGGLAAWILGVRKDTSSKGSRK